MAVGFTDAGVEGLKRIHVSLEKKESSLGLEDHRLLPTGQHFGVTDGMGQRQGTSAGADPGNGVKHRWTFLLRFDAGGPDHTCPLVQLRLDKLGVRFAALSRDNKTGRSQTLFEIGRLHGLGHCGFQLIHNRLGSALGH